MNPLVSEETAKAVSHLKFLCGLDQGRRLGSSGNRLATDYMAGAMARWGYDIDATSFECMDFENGMSVLSGGGRSLEVSASPFTTGCDLTAPIVAASTAGELRKRRCKGKILLMKGELAREHLMPRNYPFYNPDHHKEIYALLDKKQPAAILAATGKNPASMGALCPYPLFDDGDFDIPSAYCTDIAGEEIAAMGGIFHLAIDASRIRSTACSVIARKNPGAAEKIVACAHVDARPGTPGALDNASGAVVLLLLAEMLRHYEGETGIEIVAVNGEEHYSAGGELDYLRRYGNELDKVALAINIDGIGYVKGGTAFSFYECPETAERKVRSSFRCFKGIARGKQWYAGDHMVFVQGGRPAIALTSDRLTELAREIIHTGKDTPDLVDCGKLVEAAAALKRLIETY